jgi:hypothetical protein
MGKGVEKGGGGKKGAKESRNFLMSFLGSFYDHKQLT